MVRSTVSHHTMPMRRLLQTLGHLSQVLGNPGQALGDRTGHNRQPLHMGLYFRCMATQVHHPKPGHIMHHRLPMTLLTKGINMHINRADPRQDLIHARDLIHGQGPTHGQEPLTMQAHKAKHPSRGHKPSKSSSQTKPHNVKPTLARASATPS